jgi:trans-aconitate 2-methyltransferase
VTTQDSWDPDDYNRFAIEREQPFWDLVRLVEPVHSPTVVDLGCGDGRLTAALHGAVAAESTLGLDRSEAMVSAAAIHASPDVRFRLDDIGGWSGDASYDLVLANASMQWVPDHRELLTRWARSLRRRGQLAVQVPSNADHPTHLVACELAGELLADPPPDPVARNVLAVEEYSELLHTLGFDRQHVRLQVYGHRLDSSADVVEWVKGTTLTRFKEPLGPRGWDRFVDLYRERILDRIGDRSPYFYPFKRILMWARFD